MSGYSFEPAIRRLRRNIMLTALTTPGPHRMSLAYTCVGALLVLVLCRLAVRWPAPRGL